jgi:hypothetical protein
MLNREVLCTIARHTLASLPKDSSFNQFDCILTEFAWPVGIRVEKANLGRSVDNPLRDGVKSVVLSEKP